MSVKMWGNRHSHALLEEYSFQGRQPGSQDYKTISPFMYLGRDTQETGNISFLQAGALRSGGKETILKQIKEMNNIYTSEIIILKKDKTILPANDHA